MNMVILIITKLEQDWDDEEVNYINLDLGWISVRQFAKYISPFFSLTKICIDLYELTQ